MPHTPVGKFIHSDGEEYYRISAFQRMAPFLMSLASDTDLWMSVASGGGLTAGRVDPDGSLFPYLTVDQLHDAHHHTGPVTLIRGESSSGSPFLWEPFSEAGGESAAVERALSKNIIGNRIVFEEIHHGIELAFRYSWCGCDEFGWVRTATLEYRGTAPIRVALLDGLRNVLPFGAPLHLYQQASNLVDAYKKSEVDPATGLGIFSLTAGITDRAEALEVLRANTVWCCGLKAFQVHLSHEAVSDFRHGRELNESQVLNGSRGNYILSSSLDLKPAESVQWHLVADAGRDHIQIAELRRQLLGTKNIAGQIEEALRRASENLERIVGSADGLQKTGHPESTVHHFANVLFNSMRGGIFVHNYDIPVADFSDFLDVRNRPVAHRRRASIAELPATIAAKDLLDLARKSGDADFERLCYEYLPLYFGRRHGDPSRPWNRFSIRTRNTNGGRVLHYEGNWRDIFQNWEALCVSYPGFFPNVIAKFVNASTVDGHNPYRISREGVDWETADPDDPWNNIGYWGDHQIVYLLKLLEHMTRHYDAQLLDLLGREIFSYTEVPYIIKPFADILRDPRRTIEFDTARAARIEARVADEGTDGKLLTGSDGSVYHVNLLEKLLVPALTKLSNLIPDAGIWMNTQRPEWNDANNALGGGGVSVVTLCYLRRYLVFLAGLIERMPQSTLPVSSAVATWFERLGTVLERERHCLAGDRLSPHNRKRIQDALGDAFSEYRASVYADGFGGKTDLALQSARDLCRTALLYVEEGIRANRRDDGLYHSYNLLDYSADGSEVKVAHLEEMLEGQVAVLSSGLPDPEEALQILERLFASALYQPDQHSFMLYPERVLPGFLATNVIPKEKAQAIPLVDSLLAAGNTTILAKDKDGTLRFHGAFRNADDLAVALAALAKQDDWSAGVTRDHEALLALFEDVFRHKSYTGRSGVMYGYEGLGCIYWHMVAKLLLAVQEFVLRAEREDLPASLRQDLADMYFRIRSGLGFEKAVAEYGAFPTDPYSHTSPSGGAKQPGMTGHVKEVILTRMGELGIRVENGKVSFRPSLVASGEYLKQAKDYRFYDVSGNARSIALSPGQLAFTYCQVPVVYERVQSDPRLHIEFSDGSSAEHAGDTLDEQLSSLLFSRSGWIGKIIVEIAE